jgi:hypothetical protein
MWSRCDLWFRLCAERGFGRICQRDFSTPTVLAMVSSGDVLVVDLRMLGRARQSPTRTLGWYRLRSRRPRCC